MLYVEPDGPFFCCGMGNDSDRSFLEDMEAIAEKAERDQDLMDRPSSSTPKPQKKIGKFKSQGKISQPQGAWGRTKLTV